MNVTLLADGFEDAFVGFGRRFDKIVAVYSYDRCVEILIKQSRMSIDEAIEYMEFNVVGAYVGDHTPIFMIEEKIDDRESVEH